MLLQQTWTRSIMRIKIILVWLIISWAVIQCHVREFVPIGLQIQFRFNFPILIPRVRLWTSWAVHIINGQPLHLRSDRISHLQYKVTFILFYFFFRPPDWWWWLETNHLLTVRSSWYILSRDIADCRRIQGSYKIYLSWKQLETQWPVPITHRMTISINWLTTPSYFLAQGNYHRLVLLPYELWPSGDHIVCQIISELVLNTIHADVITANIGGSNPRPTRASFLKSALPYAFLDQIHIFFPGTTPRWRNQSGQCPLWLRTSWLDTRVAFPSIMTSLLTQLSCSHQKITQTHCASRTWWQKLGCDSHQANKLEKQGRNSSSVVDETKWMTRKTWHAGIILYHDSYKALLLVTVTASTSVLRRC